MNTRFNVRTPAVLLACLLAVACGQSDLASVAPIEITPGTACTLDGMTLADFPGPKAQVHYADTPAPEFYCDTVEMLSIVLRPEQARKVQAIFVQDMGQTDWQKPQGAWMPATKAFFVFGSKKHGSMGPTAASFGDMEKAKAFAAEYGGKVVAFADVKPDMVRLDGGALHDHRM